MKLQMRSFLLAIFDSDRELGKYTETQGLMWDQRIDE